MFGNKFKISPRNKIMLQVMFSYSISFLIAVVLFSLFKANNVVVETIAPADSLYNTLYFVGVILVETTILILLLKYFKKINFMKIIDVLVSFFAVFGIASIFFSNLAWPILISFLAVLVKELWGWFWYKNAIVFIVVGFFSAYIGYSLGILPIFVLLVVIAIYDYIAVFKTKHMVFLANNIIDKNTLFVMDYGNKVDYKPVNLEKKDAIPTQVKPKDHLHLGTGDFALPLLGVMTLFAKSTLWGLIAFFACVIALELTILLLFSKKHIALPAIPLQAIALLIVLGVYYLVALI